MHWTMCVRYVLITGNNQQWHLGRVNNKNNEKENCIVKTAADGVNDFYKIMTAIFRQSKKNPLKNQQKECNRFKISTKEQKAVGKEKIVGGSYPVQR